MDSFKQKTIERPARLFFWPGIFLVCLGFVQGVFVGIMDYVGIVGNRWDR